LKTLSRSKILVLKVSLQLYVPDVFYGNCVTIKMYVFIVNPVPLRTAVVFVNLIQNVNPSRPDKWPAQNNDQLQSLPIVHDRGARYSLFLLIVYYTNLKSQNHSAASKRQDRSRGISRIFSWEADQYKYIPGQTLIYFITLYTPLIHRDVSI